MSKAKVSAVKKSIYKPPVLKHLGALNGRWKIKGQIKNDPEAQIKGWESYEWMKGGFFMLKQWKIVIRRKKTKETNRGMMIIGLDGKAKVCTGRSYDNLGNVADYKINVQKGAMSMIGISKRFEGTLSKDRRSIEGLWQEKTANGKWTNWYESRMKKVKKKA
ncbi:MAG: hypothetical protein ACTHJ0_03210 [Flavipsychrobacter sp.]